jgi:hypothetical protein
MDGLAADDAAKRDRAVIRAAAALRGIERERNCSRDFERSRNAEAVESRTRLLERRRGAGQQRIGNVVVEARLHDEDARAFASVNVTLAASRSGHCPDSVYPRMSSKRAA